MGDRPSKNMLGLVPPEEQYFTTPQKTAKYIADLIRAIQKDRALTANVINEYQTGVSKHSLIEEVVHTANVTLGEEDVGKLHTDRGAAAGNITLTLPASPKTGWWYSFAHVGATASSGETQHFSILGYTALNRKIRWYDGSANAAWKIYMDRDTYGGAALNFVSLTLVALGDGTWAVISETGNTSYYWFITCI